MQYLGQRRWRTATPWGLVAVIAGLIVTATAVRAQSSSATPARVSDKPNFSGPWTFNSELSDNADQAGFGPGVTGTNNGSGGGGYGGGSGGGDGGGGGGVGGGRGVGRGGWDGRRSRDGPRRIRRRWHRARRRPGRRAALL